MNSTADEVWEFMKLKYPIEKISGGKKYICYLSTPGFEEPDIYGYNVIEAVSMLSPFPASKQFPKLIEPGRKVFISGKEDSNACRFFLSLFRISVRVMFHLSAFFFVGAVVLKCLVKMQREVNKFTHFLVGMPKEWIFAEDIDNEGEINDPISWFRIISATEIDIPRTFNVDSYPGFLDRKEFLIMWDMWEDVFNYFHGKKVPSKLLRGFFQVTDIIGTDMVTEESVPPQPKEREIRVSRPVQPFDPTKALRQDALAAEKRKSEGPVQRKKGKKPRKSEPVQDYNSDDEDVFEVPQSRAPMKPSVPLSSVPPSIFPSSGMRLSDLEWEKMERMINNCVAEQFNYHQRRIDNVLSEKMTELRAFISEKLSEELKKFCRTSIDGVKMIQGTIAKQSLTPFIQGQKELFTEYSADIIKQITTFFENMEPKFSLSDLSVFQERERKNMQTVIEFISNIGSTSSTRPTGTSFQTHQSQFPTNFWQPSLMQQMPTSTFPGNIHGQHSNPAHEDYIKRIQENAGPSQLVITAKTPPRQSSTSFQFDEGHASSHGGK